LSVSHGAGAIVKRQIAKKQKQPVKARDAFEGSEGGRRRSVCSKPRPGRGRMAIENGKGRGRRSLWGRASEGVVEGGCIVWLTLAIERAAERIEECGRATLEREMHALAASSQA